MNTKLTKLIYALDVLAVLYSLMEEIQPQSRSPPPKFLNTFISNELAEKTNDFGINAFMQSFGWHTYIGSKCTNEIV